MPRLTKIYTRTGDIGETSLGPGQRVSKDNARVRAYGEVDELNSAIGVALAAGLVPENASALGAIQNDLFHLGADLAYPEKSEGAVPRVEQRHIEQLEGWIDERSAAVGPLANFILPGGSPGAAQLQLARAICRRAERAVVTLAGVERVRPETLAYLNRLSDALFVMARFENHARGVPEPLWDSRR